MTNNNTPKSIDTSYNGYKFRSRTEARWAVFFDELRIAYDFEPKGFDLNGVRYLPDFHLTNGLVLHEFEPTQLDQIWVEIKPDPNITDNERKKMAEFVKQTDHHILLIAGQPDINTTLRFIDHHPETGWFVTDVRWLELPDGQIGLVPIENLNNSELLIQTNTPRLRAALDKARQARFEFGQTPTPPSKDTVQSKEKAQSFAANSNTKICQSCGQEFKPYRQHFIYCSSCYHKQKKQPATATEQQQPHFLRSRTAGYLFGALVMGGLIIMSLWFINSMATNGLFSTQPTPTPTTIPATHTPEAANNQATCTCTRNTYDCADFTTQTEAQACFDSCFAQVGDIHFLDSNGDGQACETLP